MTPKKQPPAPPIAEPALEGDEFASETVVVDNVFVSPPPAPDIIVPLSHALDTAPSDSKIVVVLVDGRPKAVLVTPTDHPTPLPEGDVAHKLPEGAKIIKTTVPAHLRNLASDPNERFHAQGVLRDWAGDLFVGEQLSAQEWHHPLYRHTGTDAIADFVAHFHRGYSDPDAPVLPTDV